MPIYEVELEDGRTFEVEADAPPTEQDVMAALGGGDAPASAPAPTPQPQEQGSGGASAAVAALRAGPAIKQGLGRFAANHPAAVQKAIGAGISTAAGGAGAAVGGVPGAVVGASIRGVTPAQSVIRETAGRMAGEAPAVAKNAGRALGVINYAKEVPGLALGTKDLVSTGVPTKALDSYADSMGQKVVRILDEFGRVAVGPEAPKPPKAPSAAGRLMTKGASGIGKVLGAVAGPIGMTDFAQAVEPTRRDIGVMGIGKSVDVPGMHPTAFAQLRQAILRQLGYE